MIDPEPARRQQAIDPPQQAGDRLAGDIDEPGCQHQVEAARLEWRRRSVGQHQFEAWRCGCGCRQSPEHRMVFDRSRRDWKFVKLERLPLEDLACCKHEQRIEIERDRQARLQGAMQVIGKPRRTGAQYQHSLWPLVAAKGAHDRGKSRGIFRLTPAPVAMQVRVVTRKPLVERQFRAECDMHGMRLGAPGKAQWHHQFADPVRLVVERAGDMLKSPSRLAARWALLEGRALAESLGRVVREQVMQSPAPFDQCGARFGHHPGDVADQRKIVTAGETAQAGQPTPTGGAGQQFRESGALRHDVDNAVLATVVVTAAAVYSPAMPEADGPQVYRMQSDRSTGPLRFRSDSGDHRRMLVIAHYQGPELPATLTGPIVEAVGDPDRAPRGWRITCAEGRYEFRAHAVEQLEECPALYEPLHRPFRLSTSDRLAVRVLLWLLRLPGGAALLRRWHAHRH